jgi:hypothetical protein
MRACTKVLKRTDVVLARLQHHKSSMRDMIDDNDDASMDDDMPSRDDVRSRDDEAAKRLSEDVVVGVDDIDTDDDESDDGDDEAAAQRRAARRVRVVLRAVSVPHV